MKRKIFNVLFALVLLLGMSLVMAAPVAADVSQPTVSLSTTLANTTAQYTIVFTTTSSLAAGSGTITITFPSDTTVPAYGADTYATGAITLQGASVSHGDIAVSSLAVTMTTASSIAGGTAVTVVFTTTAGIKNPTSAGAVTLTVRTSAEATPVTSASYTITTVPTVTSVAPPQANAGETMSLVTIGGTGFTGATAVSFGSGVTVSSIVVGSATSITVTIAIDAAATAGTRSVTVTAPSGTNVANTLFTVAAANTKKVDRFSNATTPVYVASYDTITLAVAAATTSEILKVHAATYSAEDPIVFAVAGVTLQSYMGADSTTIGPPPAVADPNITDGMTIKVTANDVTIGGSGAGFTIITRVSAGIWVPYHATDTATGLQILYNKFQAVTQGESRGIWIERPFKATSSTRNAIIDHNDFSQTTAYIATGGQGAPGTGIQIVQAALGASTRSLITNNTAANQRYTWLTFKNERKNVASDGVGDESKAVASMTVEGVDVYGNVVHDNGRALQFSRKGSGTESLTIGSNKVKVYKNQFYSNGDGVWIDATSGNSAVTTVGNIAIQSNDIYSNTKPDGPDWSSPTQYGIKNGQTDANVDAQYNWWGSLGGPAAGTGVTAFGAGDKVSTYVTYDPWLTVTYATYVAGGIRSYGSDAIELAVGWNTLSVPTNLKTSADTFGEIEGIGTFLTTTNLVSGYWYDAATSTWMSANTTTQLVPGRGFYINMSAASKFPILYFDGSLGTPPSYSLTAGWNFVGSMFGVDKVTTTDFGVAATGAGNGQKLVSTTLASLGTAATNVISPSVPGQVAAWAVLASDGSTYMQVGEAYWVFMSASGTLAGFEVTPYYFTWAAPGTT